MDFRWPTSRSQIEAIRRERKRIAVERALQSPFWKKRMPALRRDRLDGPEVTLLPRGTVAKDFEANVKAPRFMDKRG